MTRASTVPSPTPASNTRTAGGRGWILVSSNATREAISHFSEQVFTNSRYFCRLSKKRKLRCGSSVASPDATDGAVGFTTGSAPGGVGSNSTRRRAGAPSELCAMKARIRSSVSVGMRPPLRKRLASLPSLTARRPNADSASPRTRQNSEIFWRICSFIAAFPDRLSTTVRPEANQVPSFSSTVKTRFEKVGKVGGLLAHQQIHAVTGKITLISSRKSTLTDHEWDSSYEMKPSVGNSGQLGAVGGLAFNANAPRNRRRLVRYRRKRSRFRPAREYRSDRPAARPA